MNSNKPADKNMDFLNKLIFSIKKPPIIIIAARGHSCVAEVICQALKPYFKTRKIPGGVLPLVKDKNEILIFEDELIKKENNGKDGLEKQMEIFNFIIKKSGSPIFIVTNLGEIPVDRSSFSGEIKDALRIQKIAGIMPARGFLILNFDDETVREIKNSAKAGVLTYGFQKAADFHVSDININQEGTNFKIDYQGNIIPFWLKNNFSKEQIYGALAAICVGAVKNINLVEISQALKITNN